MVENCTNETFSNTLWRDVHQHTNWLYLQVGKHILELLLFIKALFMSGMTYPLDGKPIIFLLI
jgi:hypothetical protein